MDTLQIIKISKNKYYLSDDILHLKLSILEGCTNGRRIVDNLKIPSHAFIYAKQVNKKWIISNGKSYKFDKVMISTQWINNYINEQADADGLEESAESEESNQTSQYSKTKLMPLPGLIQLKKSEKMRDSDGNIVEIEVRGTREHNNCFFRMIDVAKGFGMNNLRDSVIRERGYQYGIHYFYFSKNTVNDGENKKIKNKEVRQLFYIYIGLLKVLFSSRNKTVTKFVDWATKTLFAAHLGTQSTKDKLSAELLGISVNVVREVFNKTSSSLPTIYLFAIGRVKDLRVTLKIGSKYDDNDIVYKGGETIDITRRIEGHNSTFGKLPGAILSLKWYNYIDPQYTGQAEKELFAVFAKMGFKFDHQKHNELLIFSKKDTKTVIQQYDNIARKYTGHIKELVDKIKEMELQLVKKDSENKLLQKENELLTKEIELQLLKKDNQILKLQHKLAKYEK